MNSEALVSICCQTYQHKPYIRQCLDGFIQQHTNFKFEVIVHDDASTDGTTEVVREFESKYPDIIKPIYQTENQFLKQNVLTNLMFPMARGEYVAICEGDDYWTDPLKLQKQVDLLEAHPESSFCFTKVDLLYEMKLKSHSYENMDHYPSRITLSDYLDHYYPIPMLTKVFRKSYLRDYTTPEWDWLKPIRYMDNVMHMCDLMKGPGLFLNEITGVYRIHGQSVTRTAPKETPWHIEEILLTHYHFVDLAPERFKEKFKAIRAFHFEKLLDFWISQKDLAKVFASTLRYLKDDRSGTVSSKLSTIARVLKKHVKARFN